MTAWILPSLFFRTFLLSISELGFLPCIDLDFGIISNGLVAWAYPWLSPKWPIYFPFNLISLINPQNNKMNIFHKGKYSFFSLKFNSETCAPKQSSFLMLLKIWDNSWIFFGPWHTFPSKNIAWLFVIFLLQKIISILDQKCSLYSKCIFPWAFGLELSWA